MTIKKEEDFYYNEKGYKVFTQFYHIKRGYCCGSGCLHCPFYPKHKKNSVEIKKE